MIELSFSNKITKEKKIFSVDIDINANSKF